MARDVIKAPTSGEPIETQRLDKWLWFARVAKTRTIASGLVSGGKVRVNRVRVQKPAHTVRSGDVVTVSVARGVRVLKVLDGGQRRGPATEAAFLYEEIVPLQTRPRSPTPGDHQPTEDPGQGGPTVEAGSGRPTKKDRRVLDRLRSLGKD